MKKTFSILLVIFCAFNMVYGQSNTATEYSHFLKNNINYELRAFFSIGGSSPLGLPREIRKLESYNPALQLGLEANATKWFTNAQEWGFRMGVSVEGKGMKTGARVKNYKTKIIQNNAEISGYFTGSVQTNIRNTYVTIPVSAVHHFSDKWNVNAGLFASILIDPQFNGYVSDGYLRQGAPTGEKISFKKGSKAAYDFSDEEQKFQWGALVGGEFGLTQHLKLFSELRYGINSLFKKDFHSISFDMHNIYLSLGFGYRF